MIVSILVLCHNQLSYTRQCLESLFANTSQARSSFEVIVVDNGSTDGTKDYLQGLEKEGKVKAVYNEYNAGFPKGNNQAAALATGEYLCLLNNDTILTEGWLEKLLRCIRTDPLIAAVGPWTNHSSGWQAVFPTPKYRGLAELQPYAQKFNGEEKYVDFLVFFCCLIKRKVWDELGGLSEEYGQGCFEDNEFCYRVLEKGYKMKLAGNCFVHHYGSATFGQHKDETKLREYASLMARNQKTFLRRVEQYRTISLCMIVSDQENPETFKRCLSSIYEWVDEINIIFNYKWFPNYARIQNLETTLRRYIPYGEYRGSRYIKFTNFSDMRNESVKMATGDYVVWLDADDVMQHPAGMRDLVLKNPHLDVFKVKVLSYTERGTVETIIHNRFFRRVKNGKTPYWVNRCHEDLSYSMNELEYKHAFTDMVIKHFGYTDARTWYHKNQRNLKLMEADLAEILATPTNHDLQENASKGELQPNQRGRLSMVYYGIVNALLILAGPLKNKKRKLEILVKALNYCDECIKLLKNDDPLMAKMWSLRGLVCMDAGQDLAAKQSFHKAYDEWQQPEAGINLAELYLKAKDFNKVIEICDTIMNKYKGAYPFQNLSYDPVQMHSLLLEKLGHAYANKSQGCKDNQQSFEEYMGKAEFYYRECIKIMPNLKIVDILIQILGRTNRLDEAGFWLIKAVNQWPKYFLGWQRLAEYEMYNKRTQTAKVFFQKALSLNPKLKESRHNLEMLLSEENRRK